MDTLDVSRTEPKTCTLRLAAERRVEPCSTERCAFWEPGGAVVEGSCVVERLGVDVRRPEVVDLDDPDVRLALLVQLVTLKWA